PPGYSGAKVAAASIKKAVDFINYYECKNWEDINLASTVRRCTNRDSISTSSWDLLTQVPDDLDTYTPITLLNGDILYTLDWYESGANTYSGFSRSDIVTKDASLNYARYKSPLPPIDDRKSCDGQGVYILSDGVPSDKTNSSIENVMSAALAGENFSCSDGLTGGVDWNCKSNFAQKLFNP